MPWFRAGFRIVAFVVMSTTLDGLATSSSYIPHDSYRCCLRKPYIASNATSEAPARPGSVESELDVNRPSKPPLRTFSARDLVAPEAERGLARWIWSMSFASYFVGFAGDASRVWRDAVDNRLPLRAWLSWVLLPLLGRGGCPWSWACSSTTMSELGLAWNRRRAWLCPGRSP